MNEYLKYRGRCKDLAESLCTKNKSLTLVRGYYYCPIWGVESQHWWCKDVDGNIVDPSAEQFPSEGAGKYTEFNGVVVCPECGKHLPDENAKFYSSFAFCSSACIWKFLGI